MTWRMFRDLGYPHWMKYPPLEMMWYPTARFAPNRIVHKIDQAFSHYLPAYMLDFISRMRGQRARWVRPFGND